MSFLVAIANFKVRSIVGLADKFCSRKREDFFVLLKVF